MNWESVIGLEIHVQLATNSKIFSGASTHYGAEPNAQACAVDLGLPGVLPVLNERAVEMAIKFGLAIGAKINLHSVFDRKNYFYPDLPKGYQISQFETPIVGEGAIVIALEDGTERTIGVTRAHLEEDAGKSIHDLFPGQTGVDLNRTGTPLLEIVSEPDFRTAKEASAYFRQMHTLVRYLQICDGNLAEGSMRCDANVSVRPYGQEEFGERTEIKNINSFRFVERAIDYEIGRQIDVLESGGIIERETRLFDPDKDETRSMRSKEFSEDYRYFPDPDLLPLTFSQALVDKIALTLPELPDAKRTRYIEQLGLSEYDARALSSDLDRSEFFEVVVNACNNAKQATNWIMGDLSAYLNRNSLEISASPVSAAQLAVLITRLDDQTLSSKTAKTLFDGLWNKADSSQDVDALIKEMNLAQVSDDGELTRIIEKLIEDNPAQFEELRNGKDKMLGFFVGQVMKMTQGKANPQQVNEIIRAKL
ncbi:Asp-tRNA(Asn)/Glu-tRNA(Gln) amidotransferase subunit GatB [Pseudomonadales bacterium]|nr:Asp-tRNA(Asn)/Glu-tRNA(Gln) amidotransferase subunit GatB [Pseudomonadales bacterium]MDB0050835.1 Asp-tRNA(Asn)/Glu-tRNA(Gln) amidotransferase subunit GatB [Pseudomonadales bacterium]